MSSYDITLYQQGDIQFIVNATPNSQASINAQTHGPGACAIGFKVHDAKAALAYALKQGATKFKEVEHDLPAIEAIGGSVIYFVTVRSLALIVACDIHPLNNLRVLNRLKEGYGANEDQITEWYPHWLKTGFDAFEAQLKKLQRQEAFCFGNTATLADLCLIPQVYNAQRFNFALDAYPLIQEINAHCLTLNAFKDAAPKTMP